jgi:hypothetical protein
MRVRVSVLVVVLAAVNMSSCASPTSPSNSNQNSTPAAPQCSTATWACTSTYGAIAYVGGAWGIAYNYGSQSAANSSALDFCAQHTSRTCAVVLQFQNACGALATAPTGQAGWASAQSGDLAQLLALNNCSSR